MKDLVLDEVASLLEFEVKLSNRHDLDTVRITKGRAIDLIKRIREACAKPVSKKEPNWIKNI